MLGCISKGRIRGTLRLEAAIDNSISREISPVLKNRLQNSGIMMQAEDVVEEKIIRIPVGWM